MAEQNTLILGSEEGIPIVAATRVYLRPTSGWPGGARFVFWCQFCGCEHVHSAENGHRAAHCAYGSPFVERGYVLQEVNEVGTIQ